MPRASVLALLALAACGDVLESPTPEATGLAPSLACNAQLVSPLTLSGSALSPAVIDAFTDDRAVKLPELALVRQLDLGGDAADGTRVVIPDDGGHVRWLDASTMSFDVTEDLALDPGIWRIEATNLDGQTGAVDQVLAIVPPPVATAVDPAIVCVDQHDVAITVTGTDLLSVDGAPPSVTIGTLSLSATELGGCEEIVGEHLTEHVERCTSAVFVLPAGSLEPGVYDLSVTNPAPAGCTTVAPLQIEVVPPPTLAGVDPALVCNEQASEAITATGTGFLALGAALPTVAVGDAWSGGVDDLDGCTDLLGPVDGSSCTTAMFTIPAASLPPGVFDVVLTNPEPADCHTEETVPLENVPPPVVIGLSRPAVCVDAPDEQLTVLGEGFVLSGGEGLKLPRVTIGGIAVEILGWDGCTDLATPGWRTCGSLDVLISEGTFDQVGNYPVQVDNPAPADCSSNDDVALEITPPPTITSIDPDTVCASGGTITITGTGFQDGAEVTVAGVAARLVTRVDDEHLLAELPAGLPGGFVEVTVANPDGCDATVASSLKVVAGPVLFFVDPPVVYGGIDLRATLFVSGVVGDVTSVSIEDASGTTLELDDFAFDGNNLVSAVIPAASADLVDGPYTVHLTDESDCTPYLDDAFAVVSDLTVSVDTVTPAFGWTGEATAVNVLGTTPPPAGEEGFRDLPRVYLSPTGGGDVATGLQSVAFVDAGRLDAVVPAGLAPGASAVTYDVIVVNPDGAIGLLPGGYTATVLPPPTIDTVSPTRLAANATSTITVRGHDFRNPTVDLICEAPGGTRTTVAGHVTSATSETIVATANPGAEGSVCVVEVNDDDGTSATWSAISARSASGNLFGFSTATPMGTPRRAPAATVGRSTSASRWLYAIGGDGGAAGSALDSVERAPVDPFGTSGDWVELPDALPEARTLAGVATVGDFVWLVGGHDGVAPVDTIERAEILDPQHAPRFDDLGIVFGSGTGLGGGTWTYRISARFAVDDPRNPDGESLASDPIVVRLPDVPDRILLSLAWTPVDGAIGYRVYRSGTADAGSGAERFLADVAGTTFTDDGDPVDDIRRPLPSGALGRWHTVGVLPGTDAVEASRESPCVTAMPDPGDADRWWILVAGGRDGNGDDRDTITRIGVDLTDPDQLADTIELDDLALGAARRACAAMSVDARFHAIVDPGEAWLYVAGGFAGNSASGRVEAFRLQAGGTLASHADATVDDVSPARAGSGFGAAGDYLFLLGGQSGNPTAGGTESNVTGPPELDNWNNLGGSGLTVARVFPGSAQDNAVLFVVGGRTGTESATRTLESSRF